jgi:protein SMG6
MLFTHIQLDDFQPTLARFIERLEIEGAEEREWIMMAVINVGAVFEYGRPGGVLRRVGGKEGGGVAVEAAAMKVMMAKKMMTSGGGEDEKMDVDERPQVRQTNGTNQISPAASEAEDTHVPREEVVEHPPAFKYAMQLTFAMLEHVLRRPTRKASPYARSSLNPYLSVVLTFLSTALRQPQTLAVMERSIPWEELAVFFGRVPRGVMSGQGLLASAEGGKGSTKDGERWVMLTSGCAPALPEDWCLRGMEWVGRKVFERGYWKSGEDRKAEIEVLEESEGGEVTDGRIENDDEEGEGSRGDVYKKRWVRIVRSGVGISAVVDGFTWVEGTREWRVEGKLGEKVRRWREEDQIEREAEERRRLGTRWADDSMDVDEEDGSDVLSEEDDDNENDTDQVKALKVCRHPSKVLNIALTRLCLGTQAVPPKLASVVKQRISDQHIPTTPSSATRRQASRQPPVPSNRPRVHHSRGRYQHPPLLPFYVRFRRRKPAMDRHRSSSRHHGA